MHRPWRRKGGRALDRATDERVQVDHLKIRLETGLDPREIKELRQHRMESLSALEVELEELPLLRRDRAGNLIEHRADRFLHRRERRLEIVRHLRDKVPLHAIQ